MHRKDLTRKTTYESGGFLLQGEFMSEEFGAGTLATCVIEQHLCRPIRAVTQSYQEYLKTEEWRRRADDARKRAGHRCQLCNSKGLLHVHHRTYEHIFDELPEDLICLCASCHAKHHNKDEECTMSKELRMILI